MKTLKSILVMGLAALAVMACKRSSSFETEIFNYEETTDHAELGIEAELPLPGQGAAAERIRTRLIEVVDEQLSHVGSYEEDRLFPAYEGEANGNEALMSYYRDKALEVLGRLSQEDYDERVESIEENDGLSDEERAEILAEMPGWGYSFSLKKDRETERYVVFLSEDYVYMGGAHGGVVGRGPLTFDKKDGRQVEEFFEPSSLEAMQPLLRKGLVDYFAENDYEVTPEGLDDILMLDAGFVPFPAWAPFPSDKGMVFTYQQYEIAAYAAGMPNFTLPYEDVLPYLTPEAKALLDK